MPVRCELSIKAGATQLGVMPFTVVFEVGRAEHGRFRVLKMDATLHLGLEGARVEHLPSILEQFESFCAVSPKVSALVYLFILAS